MYMLVFIILDFFISGTDLNLYSVVEACWFARHIFPDGLKSKQTVRLLGVLL